MTGKAHITLGMATAVSMCFIMDNVSSMEGIGFIASTTIGAIFPDIDTKQSKISYKMPIVSFFTRLIVGHRGIIHTPIFLIAAIAVGTICGFIVPVPYFVILGFSMGFMLHLIQDSFTRRGIKWLYPIVDRYYSIIPLKNNFLGEIIFTLGIYLCVMFLFVFFNPRFF